MSEISLNLTVRDKTGKEYVKKIRREGKVPGVFYFHGKESTPFEVDEKALLATIGHESSLIHASFDGKNARKCVIREIQYNPINHAPIHVDLMGILLSEKISVTVPIYLSGTPTGVKNESGLMQQLMREVEIESLPTDIPDHIDVDATRLHVGESLHLSDIETEKFTILGDTSRAVVTVTHLRISEVAEELEAEEGPEPELIGKKEEESEEQQ